MADDWQEGDLALCVLGGPRGVFRDHNIDWPVQGRVYTVASAFDEYFLTDMVGPIEIVEQMAALELVDGPINCDSEGVQNSVWPALRFIKVTPPAADEFDREVIEQMNGAPVGEPVG